MDTHTHTHTHTHTPTHSAHLKACLGSISLHLLSVDDHLNYPIPDLLADVVPGEANQVENGVNIPSVVMSVLLRQDGYLQNL